MPVLLTRPRQDSARFADLLALRGIASLSWPLTEFVSLADKADVPAGTEALIFTSGEAVRVFARLSQIRSLPVLCVADRTASLALDAGFAEVHSAGGTVQALSQLAGSLPWLRFHYLRGRETTTDLKTLLGTAVTEQVLYGADPAGPPESVVETALIEGRISVVTLWSRRNSELFFDQLRRHPHWAISNAIAVGISQSALKPVLNADFRQIITADAPNGTSMLDAISAALRQ